MITATVTTWHTMMNIRRRKKNSFYTSGESTVSSFHIYATDFSHHFVQKNLRIIYHCDSAYNSFVGKSAIIRTFSKTNRFIFISITR